MDIEAAKHNEKPVLVSGRVELIWINDFGMLHLSHTA